jgi:hypothetical protein
MHEPWSRVQHSPASRDEEGNVLCECGLILSGPLADEARDILGLINAATDEERAVTERRKRHQRSLLAVAAKVRCPACGSTKRDVRGQVYGNVYRQQDIGNTETCRDTWHTPRPGGKETT